MTKIMKGGVAYNSTSNIVALTQAEYNALSTAQKNNGNFYCITDADPSYFSAENIDYDNTDSGLSAINIQDAIDEVDSKIPTISDFIRLEDVTIGTITIGSNGYVNITSYRPAAPTGFSFLCCFVSTYSETSTKDGAMTVNAGGDYLNGAANTTVTSLRVRYVFIKST